MKHMRESGPRSDRPPAPNRAFAAVLEMLHLSQGEAALLLGLEPGTVSAYVSGQKRLLPDNYRSKGSSRNKCLSSGGSPEDELCSSTHRESCRVGYQGPRLPSG